MADGIDYTFVYGPELDDVVGGYRLLTGQATMLPSWAYGFWQCRERYKTAQEITDVLKGYRDRGAPIDNIVQDWQYWKEDQWGSHEFDATRFPDPAGLIKTIHDTYHARLMISVWPKFYTTTANYTALNNQGFVYKLNVTEGKKDFVGYVFTFYDAFNAERPRHVLVADEHARYSARASTRGGWTPPSRRSWRVPSPASPPRST